MNLRDEFEANSMLKIFINSIDNIKIDIFTNDALPHGKASL